MQDTHSLNILVNVIMVLLIVFGSFFTLAFLYFIGWVIIWVRRLYKHFLAFLNRESNPDEIIRAVDKLLVKQRTDYILDYLARN